MGWEGSPGTPPNAEPAAEAAQTLHETTQSSVGVRRRRGATIVASASSSDAAAAAAAAAAAVA